ncbi:hypothetical protein XENOCAPTIV_009719, partial [Xenoophorus captivus]
FRRSALLPGMLAKPCTSQRPNHIFCLLFLGLLLSRNPCCLIVLLQMSVSVFLFLRGFSPA